MEAYSTPGGRRPADGALSRPDMAEGALSGAGIAQGAEIALSGRDRADAAGDVGYATPGVGPPGAGGAATLLWRASLAYIFKGLGAGGACRGRVF